MTLDDQAELTGLGEPAVDRDRLTRTVVTPAMRVEVAARYEAGETGREIAEALGIARTTVLKLVKEAGVKVRHPRLSEEQCSEIATLFQAGMSQVEIAKRFEVNPSNVWHVLQRAGLVGRQD